MSANGLNGHISDAENIKALNAAFALQKAAFLKNQYPSLEERIENLQKLSKMMMDHRLEIRAALQADFGVHPNGLSDLVECLSTPGRAQWVITQLESWMQDERQNLGVSTDLLGEADARLRWEPKGVVGALTPFNFPFDLSFGPLCEQLAAGNRVIIKPSELTPNCSSLIKKMVNATFAPDLVEVILGEVPVAAAFSSIPWDHLMYTGSPAVAKLVMKAASENLTPLTLELGGKCPVFLLDGSVTARSVESILGTKSMKSGQMCVTADTVWCPRSSIQQFTDLCVDYINNLGGDYTTSADNAGICTKRHLDRLVKMVDEAKASGAKVLPLGKTTEVNYATRQMPMTLVVDPSEDLTICREEIFGPVLAVRPYDSIDDAVAYVNSKERPLGLYVFTDDDDKADEIINKTNSGGAAQNSVMIQAGIPGLAFGGIGNSGMGRCHGLPGFREFSNPKGIVRRARGGDSIAKALYPPYSNSVAMADHAFGSA